MVKIIEDTIQIFAAVFATSLIFLAIRSGEILHINLIAGIVISLVWIGLLYYGAKKIKMKKGDFFYTLLITYFIAIGLSYAFNLMNGINPFSLEVFSSAIIVVVWLATPLAIWFNHRNIFSVLMRYKFMAPRK